MSEEINCVAVTTESKPDRQLELCVGDTSLEVLTTGKFRRSIFVRHFVQRPVDIELNVDQSVLTIDGSRFVFDGADLSDVESIVEGVYERQSAMQSEDAATETVEDVDADLARLARVGDSLKVFAVLVALLGIIGGFVLALQTEQDGFSETTPYVIPGISIAVSAAFTGLTSYTLGALASAYARVTLLQRQGR